MNTFYFKIHVILSGIVQAGMASRQAKGKLRGRGTQRSAEGPGEICHEVFQLFSFVSVKSLRSQRQTHLEK